MAEVLTAQKLNFPSQRLARCFSDITVDSEFNMDNFYSDIYTACRQKSEDYNAMKI